MSDTRSFKIGDEVQQLGRTFRLTDAGWRRVNPHTGGVSEMTPFERGFFKSAANLAKADRERERDAERALAERAMRQALGT
jgi:hypothetical protein